MATPAAMRATHRLTTPSFARVAPRALPRASSSSRSRPSRVRASGEGAGAGGCAARNGADETPSTSGAVSDPARDFAVAPSPSKRRASAGRAKLRRGAIGVHRWGSGEYDGFDDDARTSRAAEKTDPSTDTRVVTSAPTRTDAETKPRAAATSTGGEGSARDVSSAADRYSAPSAPKNADTELVMVLERRGDGWAEEVFPHVAMRRRPVAAAAAAATSRRSAPDPAQAYLQTTLGLSGDEAATIVSAAAAWRVTRGGRALVDRKIMRAVQANTSAAVEALCELGASMEDVPDLLRQMPQILAVVPKDEWNRNLLEYVVRAKVPGGGRFGRLKLKARLPAQKSMNQAEASIERRAAAEARKTRRILKNEQIVGSVGSNANESSDARRVARRARAGSDPLKPWVEDVRDKRQCGRLTQEQLYLLDIAGFDATVKEAAGGESNRTWEMWFDELVEYKNVVGSCEVPENRADAGLGLWVERQRRKHAEGTLPEKALARLLALGVSFEGYEPTPAKATSKAKAKTERKRTSAEKETTPLTSARVEPTETLDRETLSMIASLKAFQKENGEYAEPPLGSELAVWLATVRARAATVAVENAASDARAEFSENSSSALMSIAERDALLSHGVELENFSPVWLGELERFASLRAHRVTLHDPKAHAAFVRRERAAANAGLCSRARLMRLRHVGMSGIAGALLLDECELTSVDECLSDESDDKSFEDRDSSLSSDETDLAYDGFDGGSLSLRTVAALPLRENVFAREAARAARLEAEKLSLVGERKPTAFNKSARARARPTPVDAPGGTARREARRRKEKSPSPVCDGNEPFDSFAPDAERCEPTRTTLAERTPSAKTVYVE
jgi:hypothetical protein